MKQVVLIIVTCILLAVCYGIVHDMVTAHICVEYFTIGHPKIIESESPVKLALLWGVIATWWVGLIMGTLIAVAARAGKRQRFGLTDIIRPVLVLLVVMAGLAVLAGFFGYFAATSGTVYLLEPFASAIEIDRHHLFLTCGWAHGASYLVGAIGTIIICFVIWKRRGEG